MDAVVNGSSAFAEHSFLPAGEGAQARLYAAAAEAFAAQGFHGTTTRDIAARAGMSPAALYVHHRSKEELLHLISSTGHARTLEIVRDAVGSSDDPVQALGQLVVEFVRHHALNHTVARVVNYELTSLSAEHHLEVLGLRAEMDDLVRGLVERGVASGAFSTPLPAMTSAAILSLGIDVARWYRTDGGWSPMELALHYRGLVLRMVGAA